LVQGRNGPHHPPRVKGHSGCDNWIRRRRSPRSAAHDKQVDAKEPHHPRADGGHASHRGRSAEWPIDRIPEAPSQGRGRCSLRRRHGRDPRAFRESPFFPNVRYDGDQFIPHLNRLTDEVHGTGTEVKAVPGIRPDGRTRRGTGSRRRPRGPSIRAGTASRTTSVSGPPRCRMKRFTRHGAVHKSSQPAAWAQRMHLRPGTRDRHRTEVVLLPKWRPDLSPRASGAPDEPKFTDSVFSGLPHHTAITAMITVGIRMTSLIVLDEYATDAGDVERTGGRGACPGDPKAAFDGKPGDPLADLSCLHRTSNGAVWVTAAYQHPWMQLDVPRILATKRIFCFDTIRIVCYVVQDNPREDSP
jgi:hypothetical protein